MTFEIVAAICFGLVAGYVTWRSLYRRGEAVSLSSIAAVTSAVGGGAVTAALGADLFAWYSIGLAASFFCSVVLRATLFQALQATAWLGDGSSGGTFSSRGTLGGLLGGGLSGKTLRSSGDLSDILGELLRTNGGLLSQLPRTTSETVGIDPDEIERLLSPEPRYADAHLFSATGEKEFERASSLPAGALVALRLSIGKLSAGSLVRNAIEFPADKVPPDADLDVMVSSTDFIVTPMDPSTELTGQAEVAHGRFFLPGNGEAARARDGSEFLWFVLKTPDKPVRARCRIGYYYKSVLVQSQLLQAAVGQEGGIVVDTDFTISADLTNLTRLPETPRISILTNSNGDGTHQIVLRKPGTTPDPGARGETFTVNELTIGTTVRALRNALLRDPVKTPNRSPAQLRADLLEIAPKGFDLWSQIPGQHPHMFRPIIKDPAAYVLQVSRPTSSGFVFPWALIYDIPLTPDLPERPAKREFCKLVTDWDGKSPLVQGSPRSCPHGPHKADVLCPFGFWGFRYSLDQISSTQGNDTVYDIVAPERWSFVVGETQYGLDDKSALDAHVERLRASLRDKFPAAELQVGKDKRSIQALLGRDLPFVYFYCHGEKATVVDPNPRLGVGNQESITAGEFRGWINGWLTLEDKVVWNETRPLIFINACSSLEIYPETLISFVDAFVGSARAAGVIGTEIQVHQYLAMQVAESFFDRLMEAPKTGEKPQTVDSALRAIRFDYLAKGSLLGLMYTPYCWSELRLTRAAPPVTPS